MKEPCKLSKIVHENRPVKIDIKNIGYCEYMLKDGQGLQEVATIMKQNQQNHFLIADNERKHGAKICFIPWIGKQSQQVCDDIRVIADCWAKSCEIDPSGECASIHVWSEELQKYVDCGPYDSY